jgi:hypothetical protein
MTPPPPLTKAGQILITQPALGAALGRLLILGGASDLALHERPPSGAASAAEVPPGLKPGACKPSAGLKACSALLTTPLYWRCCRALFKLTHYRTTRSGARPFPGNSVAHA